MNNSIKIFWLCLFYTSNSIAQNATVVDINVNNNKGTIVIREIKKDITLSRDSSYISIRIFMPFWKKLIGRGPNSIKLFLVDSIRYSLNDSGRINAQIKRGWHKISFDYPFEPPFSPFKEIMLKFNKRRVYSIDLYLPTPFPLPYH